MPGLPKETSQIFGGLGKFFLMALAHDSLYNFYKTNFALMQYHKYSLEDLENMISFERDVYVALLMQHLEEEKQRQQAKSYG